MCLFSNVQRSSLAAFWQLRCCEAQHNTNIALAHSISLPLAEKEKTATLQKVPLAQQQPIKENVVVLLFAGVTNSAVHAQGRRTSDIGCNGGGNRRSNCAAQQQK